MNGDSYRLKATMQDRNWQVAQLFVSGMAHFFVVVSGSKIHERVAHFFIDIYTCMQHFSDISNIADAVIVKKN